MADRVKVVSVGNDLSVATKTGAGPIVKVTLAGIKATAAAKVAKEQLERLLTRSGAIRVIPEAGSKAAYVEYVAFEDRTGPVWVDAGRMLVSMGYAKPLTAAFTRKAEYQRTERQADNDVTPRYPVE